MSFGDAIAFEMSRRFLRSGIVVGIILASFVFGAAGLVVWVWPHKESSEYQRGFRDGSESVFKWAKEKGIFLPAE